MGDVLDSGRTGGADEFLETSAGPVFVYTLAGELVYANDAAASFLGVDSASDLVATAAGDFTHPDHEALVSERHERLKDGEPVPPIEEKLVDAQGDVRYAILASTPIRYRGDAAIQTVAMDVTELKRRKRRLERENDRLDTLMSIISHDLKSPLSVAKGQLELAREECDSDALDAVESAHGRMETIVEETLELARKGQTVQDLDRVALRDLLDDCSDRSAETAVEVDLVDDVGLRADRERLRHVLDNLIRNAAEHGGDDVTVAVGALDSDGFYVEDDGTGIQPERRESVFEPCETTSEAGSGFGLAIVDQIVAAHGWEIDLVEGGDGGARFEITAVDVV